MKRLTALALGALAGCDVLIDECVDATFYPDHGIEVKNEGSWDARMTVVYEEWEEGEDDEPEELKVVVDTTYIDPGEKETVWYPHVPLSGSSTTRSCTRTI